MVERKSSSLEKATPEYNGYKMYFGFDTLITDEEMIEQVRANDIFLLTQDDDHIEIVNDHMRAY